MCRATVLLFSLLLCPSFCFAWSGTVIRATDGDTLVVQTTEGQQIRIRLYGIDCPEGGRPYGREATEATHSLVLGRQVEIEAIDEDRYRRIVPLYDCRTEIRCKNTCLRRARPGYFRATAHGASAVAGMNWKICRVRHKSGFGGWIRRYHPGNGAKNEMSGMASSVPTNHLTGY